MTRNLAASVRARLKQHADATRKGALLFTLWYDVAHRPTRDAEWKAFLKKNQLDAILLTDVVALLRDKFHAIGII